LENHLAATLKRYRDNLLYT